MDQKLIETARTVSAMLERLSADSVWAHRASGLRGSLLKTLEHVETGRPSPPDIFDRSPPGAENRIGEGRFFRFSPTQNAAQ